jgi:2-keto-3-deoxy-L-rhamnonate aldolase RhmA
MRKNKALAKLRAGKVVAGPAINYGSPDLAEHVAHLGFDYVWLDWQHGQFTEPTLNEALGRFLAVESTPLVRVKSHEPGTINRVLDMGAMGVIVPMVQNAAQARAIVQPVYYPPLGARSGGGVRLALIGGSGTPEYFAHANDELMLILMVETEEAIDNVEAIVRIPGVHVVLIGPGDLMIDVKARGHDEAHHERLVQQVLDACGRAGIAAGYVCPTHEMAERRKAQGFRFLCYMSDQAILVAGFREVRERSKNW